MESIDLYNMNDGDLENLTKEIPTEFPCDSLNSEYVLCEDGRRSYAYVTEKRFVQAIEKCLHDFSLFTDDELLAYLKYSPTLELVGYFCARMFEYNEWLWAKLPRPSVLIYMDEETNSYKTEHDVHYALGAKMCKFLHVIKDSNIIPRILETSSTEEGKQTDSTEDETQTDSEPNDPAAATARKGRPKSKTFEEKLVGTDEQKLRTRKRLHELMNGKSGRDAMLFINAAIKEGLLLSTVTPKALTTEFEGIGKEPNCRKCKHINLYAEAEIEAAIKRLTQD